MKDFQNLINWLIDFKFVCVDFYHTFSAEQYLNILNRIALDSVIMWCEQVKDVIWCQQKVDFKNLYQIIVNVCCKIEIILMKMLWCDIDDDMFYFEWFYILTCQMNSDSDAEHICIVWFLAEVNDEKNLDVKKIIWLFFESYSKLDFRFFVIFVTDFFLVFAVVIDFICFIDIVSFLDFCSLIYKNISEFDNEKK